MKTFKDLQFESMSDAFYNGVKTRICFENGFGASIVKHDYSYGGKDGLYELAVLFDDEIHYDNPVAAGDVRGYLSEDEVSDLLIQIQKL